MSLEEAKQFVARFATGDHSPEEYRDFLRWLLGATTEELEMIADEHETQQGKWALNSQPPSEEWVVTMEGKLDKASGKEVDPKVVPFKVGRQVRKRAWIAAASIAVLFSAGAYFFAKEKGKTDVGSSTGEVAYSNAFYNGRGEVAKPLLLPDGTKVWLNSSSSLKYSSGKERIAQLSGEAYFQVAPDSEHPFRVRIKDAAVEVLGTEFNVMAYEDDPSSKTTLVQGAVRLQSGSRQVTLKPGQQGEVTSSPDGARITVNANIESATAISWKKGAIPFQDETVRSIMRMISRYYNVNIEVDPNVPDTRYTGTLSRSSSLDKILSQLQGYLNVHFVNNGKTIKVSI